MPATPGERVEPGMVCRSGLLPSANLINTGMSTRTLEIMKNNPLKSALSILGSVAAVIIFFWAIEDRYVSAADFQQFQKQQQDFQQRQFKQYEKSLSGFRRQMLEDELFELQLKANSGTITDVERAKILRIQRQLQRLD